MSEILNQDEIDALLNIVDNDLKIKIITSNKIRASQKEILNDLQSKINKDICVEDIISVQYFEHPLSDDIYKAVITYKENNQ